MSESHGSRIELETVECPLCDSTRFTVYLRGQDLMWDLPGTYRLVRCGRCQHIYQNPRPTLETIVHCYPQSYSCHANDAELRRKSARPPAQNRAVSGTEAANQYSRQTVAQPERGRRLQWLRRLYYWWVKDTTQPSEIIPEIDAPSKSALEIGCSNGDFLEQLVHEGWDVRGVEICEVPAGRARRRGFDVHTGTLESAAYSGERFDAVFAWGVVPHLHNPKQTFREVHRILKPAGWFLIGFPNIGCWEARFFGKYWYGLQLPTQLQQYTPKSISQFLSDAGFSIVQAIQQPNVNNVIGSLGIWLRAHAPRLRLGENLYNFSGRMVFFLRVMLAPLARYLAFVGQSGRITIVAQRRG